MLIQSIFNFLGDYVREDSNRKGKIGFVALQDRIQRELLSVDVCPVVARRVVKTLENNLSALGGPEGHVEERMIRGLQELLMSVMRAKRPDFESRKGLKVVKVYGSYGAGKTTFCGKMVNHLHRVVPNCRVAVTSLDYKRQAGQEQLFNLANKVGGVFLPQKEITKGNIAQALETVLKQAGKRRFDFLLIDTPALDVFCQEDIEIAQIISGNYPADANILVTDGMVGKVGFKIMNNVGRLIPIDGVAITKMGRNGDVGTILNARFGTRKPVMYVSFSERPDDIKRFNFLEHSMDFTNKVRKISADSEKQSNGRFTNFHDFRRYLVESKSPGNIAALVSNIQDKEEARNKAVALEMFLDAQISIVDSMTLDERSYPSIIGPSRILRIAKGCGSSVEQVEALCGQVYKSATA